MHTSYHEIPYSSHSPEILRSIFLSLSSETMRLDTGLTVELWNKGMLWDKLLGTHWLPLMSIHHSNQVGQRLKGQGQKRLRSEKVKVRKG